MADVDLDLIGAERLSGSLGAAGDRLTDLTQVNRAAGQEVLDTAEIPKDTGYLASTANVVATIEGFTLTASAPYAAKVHARNPFFTDALDAKQAAVVDRVTDHAESVLATIQGA